MATKLQIAAQLRALKSQGAALAAERDDFAWKWMDLSEEALGPISVAYFESKIESLERQLVAGRNLRHALLVKIMDKKNSGDSKMVGQAILLIDGTVELMRRRLEDASGDLVFYESPDGCALIAFEDATGYRVWANSWGNWLEFAEVIRKDLEI